MGKIVQEDKERVEVMPVFYDDTRRYKRTD